MPTLCPRYADAVLTFHFLGVAAPAHDGLEVLKLLGRYLVLCELGLVLNKRNLGPGVLGLLPMIGS